MKNLFKKTRHWGQLTIIDLFEGNQRLLKDKKKIKEFIKILTKKINMKLYGKPIIKRFGKRELKGYSLMQFIETSSIVIHIDECKKRVFIDIFSCKRFNPKIVEEFSKEFFKAHKSKKKTIYRG